MGLTPVTLISFANPQGQVGAARRWWTSRRAGGTVTPFTQGLWNPQGQVGGERRVGPPGAC